MPEKEMNTALERLIENVNANRNSCLKWEHWELLISALRQSQQYARQRDDENQDLMLTVGKLRVEREQHQGRIEELETICGEAYQMVGALAVKADVFETSTAVEQMLDNLSEARLVHTEILPFDIGYPKII